MIDETTATPGPWEVAPIPKKGFVTVRAVSGLAGICDLALVGGQETLANAYLIAAAPKMRDALKQVEIILSADCTDGKLLTAIRKLLAETLGVKS